MRFFCHANSFFLIKVGNEADCDKVSKKDPYFFDGRIVMMKKQSNDMQLGRYLLTIPVWLILPGVNLKIWYNEAFSVIASAVGKPIKPDETISKETSLTC